MHYDAYTDTYVPTYIHAYIRPCMRLYVHIGGDLAPTLGGREKNFVVQIFE